MSAQHLGDGEERQKRNRPYPALMWLDEESRMARSLFRCNLQDTTACDQSILEMTMMMTGIPHRRRLLSLWRLTVPTIHPSHQNIPMCRLKYQLHQHCLYHLRHHQRMHLHRSVHQNFLKEGWQKLWKFGPLLLLGCRLSCTNSNPQFYPLILSLNIYLISNLN